MSISISLDLNVDLCIFWSGWLVTLPFLCPLLLIGFIKLKELFLKNNFWEAFKEKYHDELREVEVHEVEKCLNAMSYPTGIKLINALNVDSHGKFLSIVKVDYVLTAENTGLIDGHIFSRKSSCL